MNVPCARLGAVLVLGVAAALPSPAADFYVNTTTDTNDIFCSVGPPAILNCSLRDAIRQANATVERDTIHVPAGTYTLTIAGADEDLNATGDLDILWPVDIVGAGMTSTIIDGNGLDRVFDIHYNTQGAVQLFDLRVQHGSYDTGAGLQIYDHTTTNLWRCAIADNAATFGGGGVYTMGNLVAVDCEFSGNYAAVEGGGIFTTSGSVTLVTRSAIIGNSALTRGAAVHSRGTVTSLINSTFTQNFTTLPGTIDQLVGGVWLESGQVVIDSCTFVGNTLYELGTQSCGNGLITLRNTAIKGECGVQCHYAEGGNLIESTHLCVYGPGYHYTWIELQPLGLYGGFTPTMPPLPRSSLVDWDWSDPFCQPEDQRGVSRPRDGGGDPVAHCDVGAVELTEDEGSLIFGNGFEDGSWSAWSAWSGDLPWWVVDGGF